MNDNGLCVIAGGIGAAKFIEGLAKLDDIIVHENITVIVNVGDDSIMHGLKICPDLDTIAYTIAGVVDKEKKWGVGGDTFNCLEMLGRYYGEETWFSLGDKDLATHIYRTDLINNGINLTEASLHIHRKLGINISLLPSTNDCLQTKIRSRGKILDFEEYFVKERCEPHVDEIIFVGHEFARPTVEVMEAIKNARGIIIAPSNPYLSVDPTLSMVQLRDSLKQRRGDTLFISPIIGNEAVKGPTANIMKDFNIEPSCVSVARHYSEIASKAIIDVKDLPLRENVEREGYEVFPFDTLMTDINKKVALAKHALGILGF
ncbi:MAG: 2-phospho-L-lactate transferase [Promethearchaeota archaeon]